MNVCITDTVEAADLLSEGEERQFDVRTQLRG